MENLPSDILENILFRLPVPVMLQDRRVCTAWESLLRNYKFDKPGYLFALFDDDDEHGQLFYGEPYDDHANKNYYDTLARMEPHRFTMKNLDKDFLVGSCNGLVCLRKRNNGLDSSEICNPFTGEYVLLPKFIGNDHVNSYHHQVASGFGYCHSTKEYKVVTIYKLQDDDGHVQVYTVGSGKWKYITSIPACESSIQCSSGVYANGALHWLRCSPKLEVLAISLKDNKSYSIPFPKDANHCRGYVSFKLLGERNTLYLVNNRSEIWRLAYNTSTTTCSDLKRSYDIESSWSWINESCRYQYDRHESMPFGISSKNELLSINKDQIFSHDLHTSTINKLSDSPRTGRRYAEAIPHMHSNVSLKDLGETQVMNSYKATTRPTKRMVKENISLENLSDQVVPHNAILFSFSIPEEGCF